MIWVNHRNNDASTPSGRCDDDRCPRRSTSSQITGNARPLLDPHRDRCPPVTVMSGGGGGCAANSAVRIPQRRSSLKAISTERSSFALPKIDESEVAYRHSNLSNESNHSYSSSNSFSLMASRSSLPSLSPVESCSSSADDGSSSSLDSFLGDFSLSSNDSAASISSNSISLEDDQHCNDGLSQISSSSRYHHNSNVLTRHVAPQPPPPSSPFYTANNSRRRHNSTHSPCARRYFEPTPLSPRNQQQQQIRRSSAIAYPSSSTKIFPRSIGRKSFSSSSLCPQYNAPGLLSAGKAAGRKGSRASPCCPGILSHASSARVDPKKKNSVFTPSLSPTNPTTTNQPASLAGKATRRQCLALFALSGVAFQCLVLFVIMVLVVWLRFQAAFTTDTLLRLREEKSLGLLKLHRLEDHSLHLHELIRNRLLRMNGVGKEWSISNDPFAATVHDQHKDHEEEELLLLQHRQLVEMSSELKRHASVTALQETIQQTAVEEIIETYGEGPVRVVIEFDFDQRNDDADRQGRTVVVNTNKSTSISILLWPDAPHAAWTWLKEIHDNIWDNANLHLDAKSTMLQFLSSTTLNDYHNHHLEFVEHHPNQERSNPDVHHGPWTVGLRESIIEEDQQLRQLASDSRKEKKQKRTTNSRLEMFINLADNYEEHKHETCVGKIIDGFDTLQRLLETATLTGTGNVVFTNLSVKTVTATHHVTNMYDTQ